MSLIAKCSDKVKVHMNCIVELLYNLSIRMRVWSEPLGLLWVALLSTFFFFLFFFMQDKQNHSSQANSTSHDKNTNLMLPWMGVLGGGQPPPLVAYYNLKLRWGRLNKHNKTKQKLQIPFERPRGKLAFDYFLSFTKTYLRPTSSSRPPLISSLLLHHPHCHGKMTTAWGQRSLSINNTL